MAVQQRALVFGGSGSIGSAIAEQFRSEGYEVVTASRAIDDPVHVLVDAGSEAGLTSLADLEPLNAVAWAQGATAEDSIDNFEEDTLMHAFDANCRFVAVTMRELLRHDKLADRARLCIVSSIWQEFARRNKLTYSISKAAVGGLVRSAAIDLADRGILVNAVLPGSVDGPMGQRPQSSAQTFPKWTAHDRALNAQEIAHTVTFLCSANNTAVTGQSLLIDLGASVSRLAH